MQLQTITMKITLPLSFLLCFPAMTGASSGDQALQHDNVKVDSEAETGHRFLSKGSKRDRRVDVDEAAADAEAETGQRSLRGSNQDHE